MHGNEHEFIESVAPLLAWFYVIAAAMNVGAAVRAGVEGSVGRRRMIAWSVCALSFGVLAWTAWIGHPVLLAEGVKNLCDRVLGPVTFTVGTFAMLTILFLGRRFFVRGDVAWAGLNLSLLFMGLSLTDPQFAAIVGKPDNVPIVAMVYLLGFFVWWGAAQAVENDARLASGSEPVEADYRDRVLVWPDLVYIELICMVILTVVLVAWALLLQAPLEEPANPVVTPNPSKAPWYFLGLQEMLVFFDPSIAGVVLPVLIILGLSAIPYLDRNERGNGYYTIAERKFSYVVFQFGFLQLWVLLILIGTFMRGPNWNFFGLYEPHDPHKVVALSNISLAEYFWVIWLGQSMPEVPLSGGVPSRMLAIAWREIAGLTFCGLYFLAGPIFLGRTWLKRLRQEMGVSRYWVMSLLLMTMMYLPLKMILRWTMNMSQVVSIPEYFLNF